MIYVDNNATTQVNREVVEKISEFMLKQYGNPSSVHQLGQEAKYALDDAREKIANVINANYSDIFFTSGGTEADNWAIRGIVNFYLRKIYKGKREKKIHIITSEYEHSAILKTCKFLTKESFYQDKVEVTVLKPNKLGYIELKDIQSAMTENTVLVSIMHMNNEIGNINDIKSIGKLCREKKILFHTDAVQSYTKLPIDVKDMNIDLLSGAAHKIYGPKGIGFLYIRKGVSIEPIIYGGGQEKGMRMGTENLPGIVGFGKAAELAIENISENIIKIKEMKVRLFEIISNEIKDVKLNGDFENGYAGTLNLTFERIEAEALALSLDMDGIAISTGSACSSGSVNPSHVLLALGLSKEEAQSSIRVSLGKNNTLDEIEIVGEMIVKHVKRLRMLNGEI